MNKTLSLFADNMTAYQEAAKEAGFNRSVCAEMAGMSKAQWSQLANGDIFAPSIWTALRVAETLRVSLDALVTDDPKLQASTAKLVYRTFKRMK